MQCQLEAVPNLPIIVLRQPQGISLEWVHSYHHEGAQSPGFQIAPPPPFPLSISLPLTIYLNEDIVASEHVSKYKNTGIFEDRK